MFIDHISSFKYVLLEFHKQPSDWVLVSPSGHRSQVTQLSYGFACNTYTCRFGWIPQVLKVSNMSWGSFLAIFQESNLHSLLGKTAINHTTKRGIRPFLQGALMGFENQLKFLKAFWRHPASGQDSFDHDIPEKDLVNKPQLETGSIVNRTDSYWIYANKLTAMKIILTLSGLPNSGGVR